MNKRQRKKEFKKATGYNPEKRILENKRLYVNYLRRARTGRAEESDRVVVFCRTMKERRM